MGTGSWKNHYTCIFIQAAFFCWSMKKVRQGNDCIKTNLQKLQKMVTYESLRSYFVIWEKVQMCYFGNEYFSNMKKLFEFGARFSYNHKRWSGVSQNILSAGFSCVLFYSCDTYSSRDARQRKYEFDVKTMH